MPFTLRRLSDFNLVAFNNYIQQQFMRFEEYLARDHRAVLYTAAPLMPEEGIIVRADGTNWDPGNGAGFYGYNNGAWEYLTMPSPDFNATLAERYILNNYSHTVSVQNTARGMIKFGRNDDLDIGSETIWETGGDETYKGSSANTIDTIVSTDAGDSSDVVVVGFTNSANVLTRITQTVTLNGTTNVSLGTALNRVERAYLAEGETALVGDISITDNTAATTHLKILGATYGHQQSFKCAFSTASDEYFLIKRLICGIALKTAASCDMQIEQRVLGSVFRPIASRASVSSTGSSTVCCDFDPYIIIKPNSDVRVRGFSSVVNLDVSASVQGYFAEIE